VADYYIQGADALVTATASVTGELLRPLVTDRVVTAQAYLYHWMDNGEFGSVWPHNPRLKSDVQVLGGELPLTVAGPDPLVTGTVVVSGSFVTNAVITDNVVESPGFPLGTTGLNIKLDQPTIVVAPAVLGELVLFTFTDLTRDIFADQAGVRPSFPWLIYYDQVDHYGFVTVGGVWQINENEPFIVASDFDPVNDTTFASFGALANRIGMVIDDGTGTLALRFRDPDPWEVVVIKDTCEVRRWNATVGIWETYYTQPQRNLDGQFVFQLLDPSGVYDYYAKLCGLCMAEWSYDTARLRDFLDPTEVPDGYVSFLAHNFGLGVLYETPAQQKREFVRQFIEIQKAKGTAQSFVQALRMLGYTGYVNNVWVIPGGGPNDYIEKPIGYDVDAPSTYYPASQVAVHVNALNGDPLQVIDNAIKQEVAEFFVLYVLPAHVRIRYFVTDHSVTSAPEGVTVADSLNISQV